MMKVHVGCWIAPENAEILRKMAKEKGISRQKLVKWLLAMALKNMGTPFIRQDMK